MSKLYTVNLPVYIGNGGSSLCTGVSQFTRYGVVLFAAVSIVFPLPWKAHLYDPMKVGRLDIFNDIYNGERRI